MQVKVVPRAMFFASLSGGLTVLCHWEVRFGLGGRRTYRFQALLFSTFRLLNAGGDGKRSCRGSLYGIWVLKRLGEVWMSQTYV